MGLGGWAFYSSGRAGCGPPRLDPVPTRRSSALRQNRSCRATSWTLSTSRLNPAYRPHLKTKRNHPHISQAAGPEKEAVATPQLLRENAGTRRRGLRTLPADVQRGSVPLAAGRGVRCQELQKAAPGQVLTQVCLMSSHPEDNEAKLRHQKPPLRAFHSPSLCGLHMERSFCFIKSKSTLEGVQQHSGDATGPDR